MDAWVALISLSNGKFRSLQPARSDSDLEVSAGLMIHRGGESKHERDPTASSAWDIQKSSQDKAANVCEACLAECEQLRVDDRTIHMIDEFSKHRKGKSTAHGRVVLWIVSCGARNRA